DVRLQVDARHLHVPHQGHLPDLAHQHVARAGVARIEVQPAFEIGEDPSQLDGVQTRYELVEGEWVELVDAELPCLPARHQAGELVPGDADDGEAGREDVLHHLGNLEGRVLE